MRLLGVLNRDQVSVIVVGEKDGDVVRYFELPLVSAI